MFLAEAAAIISGKHVLYLAAAAKDFSVPQPCIAWHGSCRTSALADAMIPLVVTWSFTADCRKLLLCWRTHVFQVPRECRFSVQVCHKYDVALNFANMMWLSTSQYQRDHNIARYISRIC